MKKCGDCQLCCKLLPVDAIGKKSGERCKHQKVGKGCSIYDDRFARPAACAMWSCLWRSMAELPLSRPDRAHYLVDPRPDFIVVGDDPASGRRVPAVQIWCDPGYPEAHRDPQLREWLQSLAGGNGLVAVCRYGARVITMVPPSLAEERRWTEIDSATLSGAAAIKHHREAAEEQAMAMVRPGENEQHDG